MIELKRLSRRVTGTRATAGVVMLVCAAIVALWGSPGTAESVSAGPQTANADSNRQPNMIGEGYVFPIVLTPQQWRARLSEEQYRILRQRGTEPAFSGKYWNNHASGIYYSAATGQPLFSSQDKFDSGTGWPSFTKPIDPGAVLLRPDNSFFIHRIEVVDSLSGSHLGHVFDDGPPPTHKRYCIDSAALIFVPTGGAPPPGLSARGWIGTPWLRARRQSGGAGPINP